ncbi:MAG TPA: LysM peptidoglycan-binding domain-containing protein [Hanamia sp.]|nr:LysM peptidoglycan-binding domain-containing protein [Hanamia sp.]
MYKRLTLVIFSFIASNFLWAQQKLEIRGTGQNIYVEHTVTPKENFYSVGRMFNVSPKEIATYNHLHFASGLNIGQHLKIPLTKNNFTQQEVAQANEALIPVYHTVTSGETLYRLGVNYNKVSLASLKQWNHLTSDALSVGTPVIIGFLKVDKAQSPLANEQPVSITPAPVQDQPQQTQVEKQPETKPEPPQSPVHVAQTNTTGSQNSTSSSNSIPATTSTNENNIQPPTQSNITPVANTDGKGYFKNLYERQISMAATTSKTGTAGVFKSTSGWQDGKFYCFSNDAVAGSILKIINNANGKSVFAKVLDAIPDISQNDGLITVVSNAAAQELGAGEDKFDCTVTFAKQ